MTIDTKNMINSILESISRIDYIKPEDSLKKYLQVVFKTI